MKQGVRDSEREREGGRRGKPEGNKTRRKDARKEHGGEGEEKEPGGVEKARERQDRKRK